MSAIAEGAIDNVLVGQEAGYVCLVTRREDKKAAWQLWVGTKQQAA